MSRYYSKIELIERSRSVVPRVRYLDIMINGTPLNDVAEIRRIDAVSCFAFDDPDLARDSIDALTLVHAPSTTQPVLIYLCSLCRDIGCGAIQMEVSCSEDAFDWENFAYVNGYDEPDPLPVGPFKFPSEQYLLVMKEALLRLTAF